MDTNERLEAAIDLLVEEIDNNIVFYSEGARSYFIENVVYIMLASPEDQINDNLNYFLEENYNNYTEMQNSLNEGIGDWVRGAAKAVGSAIGGVGRAFKQGIVGGRPAEKIAFGPAPTTQVSGRDGKEGKDTKTGGGGSGGQGGDGKSRSGKKYGNKIIIRGDYIKGGSKVGGDMVGGDKAETGAQIIKAKGDVAAQVGDNIKSQTVASETDAAQIASTDAQAVRSSRSRSKASYIERHGEEEGMKRYQAYRASEKARKSTDEYKAKDKARRQAKSTAIDASSGDASAKSGSASTGSSSARSETTGTQNMGGNDRMGPSIIKAAPAEEKKEPESKPKNKTPKDKTPKTTRSAPARGAGGRFAPTAAESESLNADTFTDIYSQYMDRFLQG